MKELVAKQSILFESKLYGIGEKLPTKNPEMTEAWLEAGTAVWTGAEVETDSDGETEVKARPVTAEPGIAGEAVNSDSMTGEDLVGRVPKTSAKSRK